MKFFICIIIIVEIVAVLFFSRIMTPIKEEASENFWKYCFKINLTKEDEGMSANYYLPRDGWYIYYFFGFHGQILYRVRRSEAIKDYPKVLETIEQSAKLNNASKVLLWANEIIEQNRSVIEKNPDLFLTLLHEKKIAEIKKNHPYYIDNEEEFEEQWVKAQRYWLNILFECLFFIGITLFAFWPWLRNKSSLRASIHLGLLPFILFLPFYLGYAPWTLTSAGPSGGILYPWIIFWFPKVNYITAFDIWLVNSMPNIFEPISQPMGPMMSVTHFASFCPTACFITGLLIFMVSWITLKIVKGENIGASNIKE